MFNIDADEEALAPLQPPPPEPEPVVVVEKKPRLDENGDPIEDDEEEEEPAEEEEDGKELIAEAPVRSANCFGFPVEVDLRSAGIAGTARQGRAGAWSVV